MALENAPYGVRVNAILPGLMDTPMAIERRARERGVDQQVIRDERNAQIPLGGMMGTSEDVANAALFLASDEARFVSGVLLLVDGARSCKVG
jgi:NAD(P)-dependent dehydrogenase (short-subunit alcohol dehydrogenase family)